MMPDMRFLKYLIISILSFSAVCCSPDRNNVEVAWQNDRKGGYSTTITSQAKSFLAFCLKHYDQDKDGSLSSTELSSVTVIDCSGEGLTDMKGLGNFPSLDTLRCDHNYLKELDLSQNPKLRFLDCSYNYLEKLDLSLTNVSTLYCYPMTDASGNNLLQYIFIYRGQTIKGVTDGRDSSKGDKRIPDETTIVSVPTSKDADTDTQKADPNP